METQPGPSMTHSGGLCKQRSILTMIQHSELRERTRDTSSTSETIQAQQVTPCRTTMVGRSPLGTETTEIIVENGSKEAFGIQGNTN